MAVVSGRVGDARRRLSDSPREVGRSRTENGVALLGGDRSGRSNQTESIEF